MTVLVIFFSISVKKMRDFIFVFRAKNRFLGLKPWPDAFLPARRVNFCDTKFVWFHHSTCPSFGGVQYRIQNWA